MKTTDFPAGHSTDTDWFAVDKDGNIGFFDSGHGGAVPIRFRLKDVLWNEIFKYAKPVSKGLRQLILNNVIVQKLISKCTVEMLEEICIDDFTVWDGCLLLLNEGKTWKDLGMEDYYAKSSKEYALLLSNNAQLYMLYEVDKNYSLLVEAIKKNIIAKACSFRVYGDNYEDTALRELGGFIYICDGSLAHEPYYRFDIPEHPLNISQFDISKTDDILHFGDISFKDKKVIHPMEYVSCNAPYLSDYETPAGWTDNDYGTVMISDKEWAQCLLSINDRIENKIHHRDRCKKCYPRLYSHTVFYAESIAHQDYPPIVIIRDFYCYDLDGKHLSKYNALLQCLYDTLNIKNYDCFMTYCAKCYLWQSVGEEFLPDRIASKFSNCHKHIETELSVLQPLLLIAFEETVVDLLKIHYQINGFSGTPCLCQVSIDGKIYPLLALPQAISQEEIADLSFKLSNLANEVKTILSQQREMLETKPRTVRFKQTLGV